MIDHHTHSTYSFDVDKDKGSTIDEMCKQAIKIGLKGIVISDHYEIVSEEDKPIQRCTMDYDFKDQKKAVAEAKEKYKGKLKVIHGVELGSPSHDMKETNRILRENDFDYVVVSCHRIRGHNDFYFVDFETESDEELKRLWLEYLEELKEQISLGIGDSIAHITYPYRYFIRFDREKVLDMKANYKEYFEDVLKLIIEKDMDLEVNTSGLRQNHGDTLPNGYIVDFYRELGGKKIVFGSDAHTKEEIGAGII